MTATAELQRRTLRVLVVAQVLSGAGLAAGITVGALLAQDMLGTTGLAGLPSALFTAGSALSAVAVGRISQSRGRRPGLAAGYAVGAVGSGGVVLAAVVASPVLLFVTLFLYGAGSATNLQARYAGADLADSSHRARAISTVLVATTLGGVVGPLLAAPTGDLAHHVGVPHLAGPFLLSGAAYGAAAIYLALRLRPDPLLHAQEMAAEEAAALAATTAATPGPVPLSAPVEVGHGVALGTAVMVLTQVVMVAIMTMTPVHMHDHGHGTAAAGAVIAVHVAAMYLPSPLTGRLVDRVGRTRMAVASGVTLLMAGLLAAAAPAESVVVLAVALALLGLGWNFGLVSGTAIITDAVPLATRARTQGLVDVSIAIAGVGGGLASGIVVDVASYSVLSLAGGLIALAVVPAIAASARLRPVGAA
ncbi:MFS transporter [Nocardioides halotolerans]|uniref:MFS transporter n=1 Tax=Nocardioides halotolerans TaxID=433660 RepID=UPI00041974C4|nr:MFS transporter [Nocardioides halotolerans]